MHADPKWRRLGAPLLAMLLLLGGCSVLSIGWRFADGVIVERVDDWVALTPAQRERLEQRLGPWLDRTASRRFPGYSVFFREAAQRVRGGIVPADGPWAWQRVRSLYQALVNDVLQAWLAPVLADLDPVQLRHLRRRMETANDEYRARSIEVTRRESQRALASRIIDTVENWTGPLSVQQTEMVYRGIRELPDTSLEWYEYRLRKQAGLLALLRSDPEPAAVATYMSDWWIERSGLPAAEREAFDGFRQQLVDLLTELTLSLTPRQRASVDRRLRTIVDELEVIRERTREEE